MKDGNVSIDGHEIELSNLDKTLFPDSGITKGQLVDYYRRIAPVALRHFRDRPVSMQRFPDGIGKQGFFQKNMPDYFPDWMDRVTLEKEDGQVTHVVVNDAASLVWLADQACITAHLALSRRDRPDRPDRLVFDLDPSGDDFSKVRRSAGRLRKLLDQFDVSSFVQTTGSRGLHVVIALDRSADFDDARDLARSIAERLAEQHPDELTVEQRKNRRGDRIFIDYLRNAYGQTAVAPYAVRAIEGAPVATPLDWDEVGAADLDPQRYTIENLFRRLGQREDPWRHIDRHACSVDSLRRRLAEL